MRPVFRPALRACAVACALLAVSAPSAFAGNAWWARAAVTSAGRQCNLTVAGSVGPVNGPLPLSRPLHYSADIGCYPDQYGRPLAYVYNNVAVRVYQKVAGFQALQWTGPQAFCQRFESLSCYTPVTFSNSPWIAGTNWEYTVIAVLRVRAYSDEVWASYPSECSRLFPDQLECFVYANGTY